MIQPILRFLIEITKVNPASALKVVLMAIGVLTVALETLKAVAEALSAF